MQFERGPSAYAVFSRWLIAGQGPFLPGEHSGCNSKEALPRMRSFPAGLILPENVLEHAGTCWMRFEKDPRAGRGAFST